MRRLVQHIRKRWPRPRILLRGDSHYARPEAMDWCEANGVEYIFGLAGSRPLMAKIEAAADAVRTRRALEGCAVLRDYGETTHRARSWSRERSAVARTEATTLGLDVRFVVTNLALKNPRILYETIYCARGQTKNLIKAHKVQLASGRTSCRRPQANQVRLVLHTAAYWLLLAVRDAVPSVRDLARAEFATIRLRLAFAANCREAALFTGLANALRRPVPTAASP